MSEDTPQASAPKSSERLASELSPSTGPAGDLAAVWDLLDALPPAHASVDLAATTVDLVAAKVAGSVRSRDRELPGIGQWIGRIVVVVAALSGGLLVGHATAPDPNVWVLENMSLIEHMGILQEAGSVEFLTGIAERMTARQGPPRWLRYGRDQESLQEEAQEFDAALASLEAELAGSKTPEERRQQMAALPARKRTDFERAAETYQSLSSIDKRELKAVARALANPTNQQLRDAARMLHVIVASMNPIFRRSVIEMPASERLEMLERTGERFEPRPPNRPREDERDRKPPGSRADLQEPCSRPFRGGPTGPGGQGRLGPAGPRPFGPGGVGGKPPVKAAGPPPQNAPPEAPSEKPANPR